MKEYITIGVIGIGLVATAAIVGLNSTDSGRSGKSDKSAAGTCPTSRAHIEVSLQTTEKDGMYYKVTRKSVHTPIRDVIIRMGGKKRARETSLSTRTFAKEKLAEGVTGGEERYYLDTIMRADALITILDCIDKQQQAAAK
jgi:hypothetical protein